MLCPDGRIRKFRNPITCPAVRTFLCDNDSSEHLPIPTFFFNRDYRAMKSDITKVIKALRQMIDVDFRNSRDENTMVPMVGGISAHVIKVKRLLCIIKPVLHFPGGVAQIVADYATHTDVDRCTNCYCEHATQLALVPKCCDARLCIECVLLTYNELAMHGIFPYPSTITECVSVLTCRGCAYARRNQQLENDHNHSDSDYLDYPDYDDGYDSQDSNDSNYSRNGRNRRRRRWF
jgi:hypothetical protein